MKFIHNDTEHRIVFSHPTATQPDPTKFDRQITKRFTMVRIYSGPRGTTDEIVVTGAATGLESFDRFCFDKQRKLALRLALSRQDIGRAFRTAAWKAYHQRPGGLHYQPEKAMGAAFTTYDQDGNYVRGYDEFLEVLASWRPFGDDEEKNQEYRELSGFPSTKA